MISLFLVQLHLSVVSLPESLVKIVVSEKRLASDNDKDDSIPWWCPFLCTNNIAPWHRFSSPEFKFSVQDLISNCLWDGYLLKEAGMGQERDADCDAGLRAGTSDWECWSENGPSELSQVGLRCPGLYSPTSISQGTWDGERPKSRGFSIAEESTTFFLDGCLGSAALSIYHCILWRWDFSLVAFRPFQTQRMLILSSSF